jgi:hypothetical protein
MMTIGLVAKRQLFAPFVYKNDLIAKTGSGQTQGKHSKGELQASPWSTAATWRRRFTRAAAQALRSG